MSENNKSARKKYIQKKTSSVATKISSSPKLSNNRKIRPVRKISKVSSEKFSRNRLFLEQQRQHILKNRIKPLTIKQKKRIKESLKDIKRFEGAPFMLVYAFGLVSLLLSLYSLLTSILTSSIDLMLDLLLAIPFLGWVSWTVGQVANAGVQAIAFGLSILVGLLQFSISMYVSYFIWRYSTFMQRFLVRRFSFVILPLLSLIPLINLIPWTVLSVFALQRLLKKRSREGYSVLKKYRVKF